MEKKKKNTIKCRWLCFDFASNPFFFSLFMIHNIIIYHCDIVLKTTSHNNNADVLTLMQFCRDEEEEKREIEREKKNVVMNGPIAGL